MKTNLTLLFTAVFVCFSICAVAQINDPKKEAEKESTKRVNKKIDKEIDNGLDKIEKGFGSIFGKKKKNKKNKGANESENQAIQTNEHASTGEAQKAGEETAPELNWSKYDFVPGEKVIFEDNQENEENGEFPSRWDLIRGNVEMAVFGGENVIMFRDGGPSIIPYLKNPGRDYLPDVFTIEMDLYHPGGGWFNIYLYDRKNQDDPSSGGYTDLEIEENKYELGQAVSRYPDKSVEDKARWFHISIAYTSGKLKAYMDETRLINIPHLNFNPTGLTLHTPHAKDDNLFFVKNVRIAEGGVKYYDRFLQDGKIIANGIRFDVNKATLRPESMGVINEIAELMKDHPEIKFSVEGHTDSDGDDALNQTLSENRAQTVLQTLEKLGIESNRLSSRGWGESKPIDTNDTPEGKANNRRVEFVKI